MPLEEIEVKNDFGAQNGFRRFEKYMSDLSFSSFYRLSLPENCITG